MPSRLNYITKKRISGKKYYTNLKYPEIPLSIDYLYITTTSGDRLDSLAYRFYGDVTLWWVIAKANGFKGKVFVPQDTEIRIPGNVSKVLEDFNNLNN